MSNFIIPEMPHSDPDPNIIHMSVSLYWSPQGRHTLAIAKKDIICKEKRIQAQQVIVYLVKQFLLSLRPWRSWNN